MTLPPRRRIYKALKPVGEERLRLAFWRGQGVSVAHDIFDDRAAKDWEEARMARKGVEGSTIGKVQGPPVQRHVNGAERKDAWQPSDRGRGQGPGVGDLRVDRGHRLEPSPVTRFH